MPRVAAIDVGTNSVRCLIAEPGPLGSLNVLGDLRSYTRLGRGLAASGRLAPDARSRTIEALVRMQRQAASMDVDAVRAIATAALREAADGEDFVERVSHATGLDLDVVPPEEEGRLAFLSAAHAFDLDRRAAVFDLGGGSLELATADERGREVVRSVPLGAVTVSEAFADGDPISRQAFTRMREHVRGLVAELVGSSAAPPSALVGSGGTVRAIAALTRRRRAADGKSTHLTIVPAVEVRRLVETLRTSSAAERLAMPRMPKRRADIITAGTLVVAEVMAALKAEELSVNAMGVREGIALDLLAKLARGYRQPQKR